MTEKSRTPSVVAASSAILAASASASTESGPALSRAARSAEPSPPAILRDEAPICGGVSGGSVFEPSSCSAVALHRAAGAGPGQGGPPGDAVDAAEPGAGAAPGTGCGASPNSDASPEGSAAEGGVASGRDATAGEESMAGVPAGGVGKSISGPFFAGAGAGAGMAGEGTRVGERGGVCGRMGLRSANPGGGPAEGAARASGAAATAGAGTIGAGTAGAGTVGAGTIGAGTIGAGPVGAGTLGAGPVGAGTAGAGTIGAGTIGAGPVGAGTIGAEPVGAGTAGAGDLSHSRIWPSSSGARPAKRICADGPGRTTRPHVWNAPHERRTVSPALSGRSPGASTPAGVMAAASTCVVTVRVATETGASAPPSGPHESPIDPRSRETDCSLGTGMKSRSLAPARKQSSRCAA